MSIHSYRVAVVVNPYQIEYLPMRMNERGKHLLQFGQNFAVIDFCEMKSVSAKLNHLVAFWVPTAYCIAYQQ